MSPTLDKETWEFLTLQDIETDSTKPINVGVINLGQKADLWRSHGVVFR